MHRAGDYFLSLVRPEPTPYGARAGLSQLRVTELLERLGNPQRTLPALHIAGSKGKGSTALFSQACLKAIGHKTGTFLSPHLQLWTERFLIDGVPVSEANLMSAVDVIRPHIEALTQAHPEAPPSFFDALTATAFLLFKEASVEFAVVETGLGGRFDATIVCDARVTCITSIELEHTDKLGNTLESIASHKAGIIRKGRPTIVGALGQSALNVVLAEADSKGSPVSKLGVDFFARTAAADLKVSLDYEDPNLALRTVIACPARHAALNAALAIASVKALVGDALTRHPQEVASALSLVKLPGRMEVLSESPLVVVDAAHTVASATALASFLRSQNIERLHLVISMSEGKQVASVLEAILPLCSRVTVTDAEPSRSMGTQTLCSAIKQLATDIELEVNTDVRAAISSAFSHLNETEALCVTGSVYLAGAARGVLTELSSSSGG